MQRKYLIIGAVILVVTAFVCTLTGFSWGREPADCPDCPDCPEIAVAGDCPECPDCPEIDAAVQEVEVTRIVEVEKQVEVEVIVTATPLVPVVQFTGPGMWLVGTDIEAGAYKVEGSCYWERLSCLDGSFSCITANANVDGQSYIEILASDKALNVSRACTFTKQ